MRELHLHVTARTRDAPRLDEPALAPPGDPAIADVAARAVGLGDRRLVLRGGEPTLRDDLPALLGALRARRPWLRTDAIAIGSARLAGMLRQAGLAGMRVVLHAARADAHDWLVGASGACKAALRALRAAAEAGLATEIEATITRPTAPHLDELVALGERLGVRALILRRLVLRGAARDEAIMLSPRIGLLEDALEGAAAAAARARIALRIEGLPRCTAPRLASAFASPGAVEHAAIDDPAWNAWIAAHDVPSAGACPACPGASVCTGAPRDYVERFGWNEIVSERDAPERAPSPALDSVGVPEPPPPRAGRAPASRLRTIRRLVARGAVGGDPALDAPGPVPSTIRIHLVDRSGAPIPTRTLRYRMIRAAQEGAATLRCTGPLDHPALPEMLREAARLPGARVEVAGDLAPFARLTDAQVYETKGLSRLEAVLAAPDELEQATHVLERARSIASVPGALCLVLRGPEDVDRWKHAPFPEPVRARLSPHGGSIAALADRVRTLPDGPLRQALARVLPRCVLASHLDPPEPPGPAFEHALVADAPMYEREPLGAFEPCSCGTARCPGVARGWSRA